MLYIIYAIHVVICLFLIMVVLLQQGSGADLSVFGGGGTQTAFGARSATSLLHKLTVAGFVGFILTTIAFGFLKTGGGSGGSVMSEVEQAVASEAAEATETEEAAETEPGDTAAPVAVEDSGSEEETATSEDASAPSDGADDTGETTDPETPDGP
ncbi:MAG: preprotein translocase subunit SecG [bacterium]|nr:preprotein translocase subunit SecG [bacterium]